jgi:hypothetical protein
MKFMVFDFIRSSQISVPLDLTICLLDKLEILIMLHHVPVTGHLELVVNVFLVKLARIRF